MDEMDIFKKNAKRLGLCDAYTEKWNSCGSKRQLFQLACDANGMYYLADMCARGYGLSADFLCSEFGQFLNGNCITNHDGYTSTIYCRPDNDVHIHTTAALIIDCDNDIVIDRPVCELYIVNSRCNIIGDGKAIVYLFNSEITNSATASAIVKESK